jgi:Protein of unknown function (DUF1553)/Protein of unknown function (DUF1549)/Planctomycete cytochrome C
MDLKIASAVVWSARGHRLRAGSAGASADQGRCAPVRRPTLAVWQVFGALAAVLHLIAAGASAVERQRDRVDDNFFESKVRPVLAEHCYKCHSAQAKAPKGGLRLDSLEGMKEGGDTGPAVVPGDVEASLLVKAVKYNDDVLRMPPKGRLPSESIDALAQWIKDGAAGPHGLGGSFAHKSAGIDFDSASSHWAYQPVKRPAIPTVRNRDWARTPVDSFMMARLDLAELTPSPPADRRTLIRRAYYDLIGLPPTAAEVGSFESDRSPEAFERVVDRLLASPHYGERWGRHWLDVARYADTKDGVLMFGDDRVRPYAYTYRDYVIHALNLDLGFDRFVHEQLAADVVAPKEEPWRLAAMGFLTLGRGFDNNIYDQIDDRIDTVTRGFLGLTVACARCHDHKYDAIPTADYYALYGVFASSEPPLELPLIGRPDERRLPGDAEKQAAKKRDELRGFLDGQFKLLSDEARQRTPDYLVRAGTMRPDPLETAIYYLSLAPEDLRPQIVARWRRYLDGRARLNDPVFGPWHDLMAVAEPDFAASASAIIGRWISRPSGTQPGQLNSLVAELLRRSTIHTKADVARAYGELIRRVGEESRSSLHSAGPGLMDRERLQIRAILAGQESPAYFPKSQTYYYMSRSEKDGFGAKLTELDRMAVKSPSDPPRAMVLLDAEELNDPRIFVRGNPAQPGERVPRQFLRVLAGPGRRPFSHGSGRLDLADAITSPANPLTSRVIVNRVWMHHFGEPMVSSPSDFGTRSTAPSHPDLLDYLAARLMEDGWSLKSLHRSIMLSATYQQSSLDRPACRQTDPENHLLWRFPRHRLDLEAMRDTLLFVSGRLDLKMGGRPVDVAGDPRNGRRTVYGMVDRQSLPAVFRAFDFASPDQSAERRPRTTVPQQALFSMNSPFVIEQAEALAARLSVAGAATPEAGITALYLAALGRAPIPAEVEAGRQFLISRATSPGAPGASRLSRNEQLSQVLLMTNELLFVD